MTPHIMLFLIIPTVVMSLDDFRHRKVSLSWMLAFGIAAVLISLYTCGADDFIYNIFTNSLLLAYLGLGIVIYLWVKNRGFTNPFKQYLGAGDLMFVLFLTPLFEFRSYAIFLVMSMCGSLLYWIIHLKITKKSVSIPLVGTLGIAFCGYLLINTLR